MLVPKDKEPMGIFMLMELKLGGTKIGTTPSMISIYKDKNGVKTAKYVAQGKEAIITALERQFN